MLSGIAQHIPIENTCEGEGIARVPELKPEPKLAAGQEGHLEEARLDFVVIGPSSHFGHDGAQLGARSANLNNVHGRRLLNRLGSKRLSAVKPNVSVMPYPTN